MIRLDADLFCFFPLTWDEYIGLKWTPVSNFDTEHTWNVWFVIIPRDDSVKTKKLKKPKQT